MELLALRTQEALVSLESPAVEMGFKVKVLKLTETNDLVDPFRNVRARWRSVWDPAISVRAFSLNDHRGAQSQLAGSVSPQN